MELEEKITQDIKTVLEIVEDGCSCEEWFGRYLPELETLLSLRDIFTHNKKDGLRRSTRIVNKKLNQ